MTAPGGPAVFGPAFRQGLLLGLAAEIIGAGGVVDICQALSADGFAAGDHALTLAARAVAVLHTAKP